MKKYDEDLNSTLIFVSFVSSIGAHVLTRVQAGLFSAVTSAFILDVQSQLQPDTGEETAALLRVLIHKIDNTTFGNDPPSLPQWTGPPHMIVQVQVILYASLVASLLSAFFAMLGKQWLNRYASTDMRGTAIERSRNRQRKLDGVIAWHFDHVMECLPLMLQVALLLLGCALSRYLWGINVTVASVVLGVTSSGVLLYVFIIAAGTFSASCPYQTPGSHALRYLGLKVQNVLRSVFRNASEQSEAAKTITTNATWYHPWWSRRMFMPFCKSMARQFPRALAADVLHIGRVVIHLLIAPPVGAYRLGAAIIRSSVGSARRVHDRLRRGSSTPGQGLDQQTTVLDLRCISWVLRTSLDKADHLSALKNLTAMVTLADFDPTLVEDCLNVFISCTSVDLNDCKVGIVRGLEQLAEVSAMCFLRTFHHLSIKDPTSGVLEEVCRRYDKTFPFKTDFEGLPFYYTMAEINPLGNQRWWYPRDIQWGDIQWNDGGPSTQKHVSFARSMAEGARVEYQQTREGKVPRWILRFALHSLSLDPLPPMSIVADCLSIITVDLDCDTSHTDASTWDERYVRVSQMTITLTFG